MRSRLVAVLALLALVGGCGGSGRSSQEPAPAQNPSAAEQLPTPAGEDSPPAEASPPAEPAAPAAEASPPAADPAELEAVVQAWSEALNAGDNEAAADLFAPEAGIVQGGVVYRFATHEDAVLWNAGLPCSGTIVETSTAGNVVTAVFVLGDRSEASPCDAAPGTREAAQFLILVGKIAVWQQIPAPEEGTPQQEPPEPDGSEPVA